MHVRSNAGRDIALMHWVGGRPEAPGWSIERLRRPHDVGRGAWLHLHHDRVHKLTIRRVLSVHSTRRATRGVVHGVVESGSHSHLAGYVRLHPLREIAARRRRQAGMKPAHLSREAFVFFFVHLLVHDVFFGDAESTSGALLVNLGRAPRGFDPRFQGPITAPGSGNIRPDTASARAEI